MADKYYDLLMTYAKKNFAMMLREPSGLLKYKYIVPGSVYADSLWDWDSWLTDLALGNVADRDISEYEKGCILNFLEIADEEGRIPICVTPAGTIPVFSNDREDNIHKPCLALHALFICNKYCDFSWLEGKFDIFERFIGYYDAHMKHESGLYFWINDCAIGVDNDPCTFYRPEKSSASIYLNSMMYAELDAMSKLAEKIGSEEKARLFAQKAANLKDAVIANFWDERDGFFYNADINLLPVDKNNWLHSGCPRHWNTLIQRIGVWSGFMPMWAGIASPEQAERMVKENFLDERTFLAPFGVRTLSKMEKMYALIKSGNPSCWLGPIWGISNYMVYDGLVKYGFKNEAKMLAERTLKMFGEDILSCGELHEYYNPETGEGINNPGFQNWNLLALNMTKH